MNTFFSLLTLTDTLTAYIGPGAGLSAIGTILTFVGVILLILIGFFWYPLKRRLAARKQAASSEQDSDSDQASGL